MYYVIFMTDKPGKGQQRQDAVGEIGSYLEDHPDHPDVTVHSAGPTLDEEGTINGSVNIVEAPSLAAARAFLADNPAQKLGFIDDAVVRQWDWKTGCPG